MIISFALVTLLAGTASLFETAVSGQSSPTKPVKEPEQDEAIRLSSRLIMVPVSASDAAGLPVKDLKAEDIVIEEEGRPQQVVALGEPGKTPVEIALLFDVSGSTHALFDFERQAAMQFIKEVLKPNDTVSVFSIGVTPKIVKARTTSSEEAIAGIKTIGPLKEPTAFFDSIVEAAQYMDKADPGSRRVLVVISDGQENFSKKSSLSDALREVQKNDCLFYAINPNGGELRLNNISLKGQGVLESLASQTGGMAFTLRKVEELEAVFRQIAAELQAQYLFGYYSNDEKTDGSFKRLTVRAPKRPELRIRSRQGYYTAKK
jgi:Ca-activated chloride channel homolog